MATEDDDNIGNRIEPDDSGLRDATTANAGEDHPYAELTPDRVIAAVESAGFLSDARILPLNSYENRVYQVGREGDEPLIAKFYRPDRWSNEQIAEEHAFVHFLQERDIPVVAPLVLHDDAGQPCLREYEGFRFCLYPRQGGRAPELDNLDHLHHLGQFIGRIHKAGEAFPFRYRVRLTIQRMGADSVEYLLRENFIPSDLREAYEAIASNILQHLEHCSPEEACYQAISLHGDCHAGNLLWRDERPHFVDFDDALTGPAIQDLWMMLSGSTANRELQFAEIVEGYEMFREFDAAELKLVEPLRALRVLYYAAWLARRWTDPAFPASFPWFNTQRYWSEYILELKELYAALHEPPLRMPGTVWPA